MPSQSSSCATSCGWTPCDLERDDAGSPVGRRAEDADERELGEPIHRVARQLVLMGLDRVETDPVDVVDRAAEPVRLGDRGGARLELVREAR